MPNFALDAIAVINDFRAQSRDCGAGVGIQAAAPPLRWNSLLAHSATLHSQDMVANNYFAHEDRQGNNAGTRLSRDGYVWQSWGENLAAGFNNVPEAMQGWETSPGHCANLMNPTFIEMGMACVPGNANTQFDSYWTQLFGRPR